MKTNIAKLALIGGLSIAGAATSFAQEDNAGEGADHGLSQVADATSRPAEDQLARYGYATSGQADRVVNLDTGAKYLNVTQLETVRINFAGKSVTWTFDTLGAGSFPLSKVIPGAEGITVYVAENPLYRGG